MVLLIALSALKIGRLSFFLIAYVQGIVQVEVLRHLFGCSGLEGGGKGRGIEGAQEETVSTQLGLDGFINSVLSEL